MKSKVLQKTAYCTCGAQITVRSKNPDADIGMWRTWKWHTGEGHAPCDRKTAAAARALHAKKLAESG